MSSKSASIDKEKTFRKRKATNSDEMKNFLLKKETYYSYWK